jgi:uncharacterized protein YndB with AHSA1/START domain
MNISHSIQKVTKILLSITFVMLATNFTFGQNLMELSNKQIVKSKVFNQPLDTIWENWTTHQGLKTFFGADNKIELMPNGAFEIYFLMNHPNGQKGSEGCKVLSYLPKKYFSFSWNAPPQFEEARNSGQYTWVVIEFNSISNEQTELTLTHLGWPTGQNWNEVFVYFNKAWDFVLNNLSLRDIH